MNSSLPALPLVHGALFVSSSFLDTGICPRASEYYKLHARVEAGSSAGLTFGGHLHKALSMWYRLEEYNLSKDDKLSRCISVLEDAFANKPQQDEDDFRNLSWASEVFNRYINKYEFADFDVVRYKEPKKCKNCNGEGLEPTAGIADCPWCNATGLTSVMSEVPFVVKLFDYDLVGEEIGYVKEGNKLPIYFHGFIDLLVRNSHGLIFPLDFKSTSVLGPGYWDDKRAIGQPKGYALALEQLLGIKCHGYMIHAIRTNTPPKYVLEGKPNKSGEIKKLEDWWNDSICDQRFDFGDGELEEWRTNAIAQVEQFLYFYQKSHFPQNKSACVGKYGKCQYYDVCGTFPPEARGTLLSSELYKDKEQATELISGDAKA